MFRHHVLAPTFKEDEQHSQQHRDHSSFHSHCFILKKKGLSVFCLHLDCSLHCMHMQMNWAWSPTGLFPSMSNLLPLYQVSALTQSKHGCCPSLNPTLHPYHPASLLFIVRHLKYSTCVCLGRLAQCGTSDHTFAPSTSSPICLCKVTWPVAELNGLH